MQLQGGDPEGPSGKINQEPYSNDRIQPTFRVEHSKKPFKNRQHNINTQLSQCSPVFETPKAAAHYSPLPARQARRPMSPSPPVGGCSPVSTTCKRSFTLRPCPFPSSESPSKPGTKMVNPEPCKELERRPQLFLAGTAPY